MERLNSVFSLEQLPRLLVGAIAAVGVYIIFYAFKKYGLEAGAAIASIPLALCAVWATIRRPAIAMIAMFVINYFIMGLGRYLRDKPTGTILDALIFYNLFIMVSHSIFYHVEWRRAGTGLTFVSGIWLLYCVLQLANPEAVSVSGWFSAFRSIAMYSFLIAILTQIQLGEFKYLRYIIFTWTILTLIAVGQACVQKFVGFNNTELYWLFVLGGSRTHIIYSGIRYFSFFSDAANFGGSMGMSMVVFAIASLAYKGKMKIYLMLVAAIACYGLLISGTRSALAVPFAGAAAFIVLAGTFRIRLLGIIAFIGAFFFLAFTHIGQGNSIIRRARSAFNTEDASFQVRLDNQAKLRELMADKPFGGGLGHGGGKAKEFAPNSPLSYIATDSWFVMVWVETGIVGLIFHLGVLFYILAWGSFQVLFRLRHPQVKGLTTALIAGIFGVVAMSYANEILGQIPTGCILYMCSAFIFLAPRFDREMMGETLVDKNSEPSKPIAT